MRSFFKPYLHKFILLLLCFCSLLLVSGSPKADSYLSEEHELIILWEDTLSPEEAVRRLSAFSDVLTVSEHFEAVTLCNTDSFLPLTEQIAQLRSIPGVRVAEENQTTVLCGLEEYSLFPAQWSLNNTGSYIYYINDLPIERTSLADIDINLPEAYSLLAEADASRTVTVAILDTGVDTTHPALADNIWVNENEIPLNDIDDDNNGYVDDVYGWDFFHNDNSVCHYKVSPTGQISALPEDNDNHGTHCAGIIAASQGIAGVASGIDVRILPLKIHGGEKASGSVADAVKAIKYAEAAGADICNMSWGTALYSEALETVMRESDMLFVVAAGNNGTNNNATPLYPASYNLDNMISVAFVTQSGLLAADSNYGISTVDIAAPGQDIYSTTVGGGYHYLSGSSMATPIVTGTAALLYACGDSLYPQNVKELLLQTLKPLPDLEGYVRYPGIPDAAAALAAIDSLVSDTIPPTLQLTTSYQKEYLQVNLSAEDLGGSGVRIMAFATGNRRLSYFAHGTVGQVLTEPTLLLSKPGLYTFYVSDYAGNEAIYSYEVADDTIPPVISASYVLNPDGSFRVTVEAADGESGLKRLRYLKGEHDISAFSSGGIDLIYFNPYEFTAPADALYTIYATDHRGNKSLYHLNVKKIPAERLILSTTERTMTVGSTYRLASVMLPLTTTDTLTYMVSDETMLYADPEGNLTAFAPGTVDVVVSATGGTSKICHINIIPAPPETDETDVPGTDTSEMPDIPESGESDIPNTPENPEAPVEPTFPEAPEEPVVPDETLPDETLPDEPAEPAEPAEPEQD